jgi:hypothetical protein
LLPAHRGPAGSKKILREIPLTLQLTVPAQEPTIAAPTQDTLARKASIVASKMRYRQTQSRIHNYEKLLNKALWKFLAEHAQKEF